MSKEKDEFSLDQEDMTGMSAQNDPQFAAESQTMGDLEADLDNVEDFDSAEFNVGLADYEKFIVLPKRELANFVRAVEPLTKTTVDQYGKSVQISSVDKDTVELKYSNKPYRIAMKVNNKSQKMVDKFCIEVALLKRLIAEQYASIVIVQTDDTYNLSIFDSLLFLETKKLNDEEFKFERKTLKDTIDKELGLYNFRKLGSILSTSDRASEKIIVVKDDKCYFNTGVFSACVKSPFSEQFDLLLFKPVVDLLGVLMELAKVDIKYDKTEETMLLEADGLIYCEVPVSTDITQHFSPTVAKSLNFEAEVVVMNDSMPRLFALVKSLDYLSDIVTVSFSEDEMKLTLHDQQMTKTSNYQFKITEGKVAEPGEMKVSASVMKPYLDVTGNDIKYDFNEQGLCMKNQNGSFIVRRTN